MTSASHPNPKLALNVCWSCFLGGVFAWIVAMVGLKNHPTIAYNPSNTA